MLTQSEYNLGHFLCLSHMKKKDIFHPLENFENAPVFF